MGRSGSAAVVRPEFAAVVARPGSAAVVRLEFAAVVARPGSAAVVDWFGFAPCPDGRVWVPAGSTFPPSDSSDTGTLSGSPLPASSPPSTNSSVSYCLVSGSCALSLSLLSVFAYIDALRLGQTALHVLLIRQILGGEYI